MERVKRIGYRIKIRRNNGERNKEGRKRRRELKERGGIERVSQTKR